MRTKPRQVALIASAVYLISFALPVFGHTFGILTFALGWCPPYTPFWFANVAFIYGVRKLAKIDCRRARNAGLAATLLAVLYLPAHLWEDPLHPLQIGYYTWLASMVVLAAGGGIGEKVVSIGK